MTEPKYEPKYKPEPDLVRFCFWCILLIVIIAWNVTQ